MEEVVKIIVSRMIEIRQSWLDYRPETLPIFQSEYFGLQGILRTIAKQHKQNRELIVGIFETLSRENFDDEIKILLGS